MIICANCGASNKPGSSVCRMCAAPMPDVPQYAAQPQSPAGAYQPTVLAGDRERAQGGYNAPTSSEIECSNCHTMNEAGWSFCQQCGSRLAQPQPPQPPPPLPQQPPMVQPPQPPPPGDSSYGFKTVPTEVPGDQGMRTVVADR